jgi:hypothetical protein
MAFLSGLLASLLSNVLQWLVAAGAKIYQQFLTEQQIKARNAARQKAMEDAKTKQERQDALNQAGSHINNP